MDRNGFSLHAQEHGTLKIEGCIEACRQHFDSILADVISNLHQEAHHMEGSLFQQLMKLGLLLLNLYFVNHHDGDYGETIETDQGPATRGRPSERSYFSIFGKLKIRRYLYATNSKSFSPLDVLLNLPVRCYSYFLAERVNLLNIQDAYDESMQLLEKFFGLKLCVSAAETLSQESAAQYDAYYDVKSDVAASERVEAYRVVSFDGKGVPMIKREAAKIKARLGQGEKRQKKKEALVGVTYSIKAHVRRAQEVAAHLVFPEQQEAATVSRPRAQRLRYLASVARSKR